MVNFKYLGEIISNEGSKPEILSRIAQLETDNFKGNILQHIGQATSSCLYRICTNLRIKSEVSGVTRNKQNGSKISIFVSQTLKRVTKILNLHQRNLYQFYQNKIV